MPFSRLAKESLYQRIFLGSVPCVSLTIRRPMMQCSIAHSTAVRSRAATRIRRSQTIQTVRRLVFHRLGCSSEITPPTNREAEAHERPRNSVRMAHDGAAERRRVALRVLLARGEGSSSSPPPRPEEARSKQGLASALRGLGCTSAAASLAHAPVAASTVEAVRSSAEEAEWRGSRRTRRKERRNARAAVGGGGGPAAAGGVAGDVWCTCTPGIPFAAEASSVDCVVARHQPVGAGRRGEGERRHREVLTACPASPCLWWIHFCRFLLACAATAEI
jgi:hypothetical protein